MKTIGLIGGTGWISTVEYYRIINEEINKRRGGYNYARCILYSIDYGEIETFNSRDDRQGVYSLIQDAAHKLEDCGVDCLVLCANTIHQFAVDLEKEIKVPIIHIARAVAEKINSLGLRKTGLLGTRQTMEMDFYRKILGDEEIDVIVPDTDDRAYIDSVISNELIKGVFSEKSRSRFVEISGTLQSRGAQGIILGCTEIPLLIKQEDIELPVLNTLTIHALAAVRFALGEE